MGSQDLLTEAEARRAIYIDFEGNENRAPTLLGVLWNDAPAGEPTFEQAIVEEAFRVCAGKRRGSKCIAADLQQVAEGVVRRAHDDERRIVSWSNFDRDQLATVLPAGQLSEWLMDLHRNAIPTARKWLRNVLRIEPPPTRENRLSFYLDRIGYRTPDKFGPGNVGEALRDLRPRLETLGATYESLKTAGRDKWRAIVGHNRHDCYGVRHVMLQATRALSA